MKTSALRRWLVLLGLIALGQTTRFTGGYDLSYLHQFKYDNIINIFFEFVFKVVLCLEK